MGPSKGPGPDTKGGGQRGGPRRWTGAGPRPARHIPWPEIFKHHQSNLTGHLKMVDMVRKHCVPGSGNERTATRMVDRTNEMIRQFKELTRTFVPPRDNLDRVPLGASSASMYPGYSPADHIYSEASAEYGQAYAEAKRKGVDFKPDPNGPEYLVGHAQLSKRQQLAELKKNASEEKTENGVQAPVEPPAQPATHESAAKGPESTDGANPYFVIDSNPTPVQLPHIPKTDKKRALADGSSPQANAEPKKKKAKIQLSAAENTMDPTTNEVSQDAQEPVAAEDISAEVEARLRAKEEKRRKKEAKLEKKRKLESDDTAPIAAASSTAASDLVDEATKRKQKKAKTMTEVEAATGSSEVGDEHRKKKKRRAAEEDSGETKPVDADGEEKKKQRKKERPS